MAAKSQVFTTMGPHSAETTVSTLTLRMNVHAMIAVYSQSLSDVYPCVGNFKCNTWIFHTFPPWLRETIDETSWVLGTMPLWSWVALTCWAPLPPVVHQHKSHGHGQARPEQKTMHAEHAEISWVCRNDALHAGAWYLGALYTSW